MIVHWAFSSIVRSHHPRCSLPTFPSPLSHYLDNLWKNSFTGLSGPLIRSRKHSLGLFTSCFSKYATIFVTSTTCYLLTTFVNIRERFRGIPVPLSEPCVFFPLFPPPSPHPYFLPGHWTVGASWGSHYYNWPWTQAERMLQFVSYAIPVIDSLLLRPLRQ